HPCRGCKDGASRDEAGRPDRWDSTRVSGGGRQVGKGGQFRAESFPLKLEATLMNADGHVSDPLTGIVWEGAQTFRGSGGKVGENARYWIQKPEAETASGGGYFRQTYRSQVVIAREALP